jgi:hypothetical protein
MRDTRPKFRSVVAPDAPLIRAWRHVGMADERAGLLNQKGTLNKLTTSVKDAIEQVAERIGGVDRMVEWVQEDPENERVFWVSIYPKLLPVQLAGDKYNPVRGDITFTWTPPAD